MSKEIEKRQRRAAGKLAAAIGVGLGAGLTLAGCSVATEVVITTESNIPYFYGLWFDQVSKNYYAEYGNPYGLITNERAGVLVDGAVVINGRLENGFGLRPEVLRAVIDQNFKDGIYKVPLPFNLEHDKGLVMRDLTTIDPTISPDARFNLLGVKIPTSTIIYAPVDSPNLTETQEYYADFYNESFPTRPGNPYFWLSSRFTSLQENFDFFFQQWSPYIALYPLSGSLTKRSGSAQIGEPLGVIPANVFVEPFKNPTLFANAGNYEIGFMAGPEWSKPGGEENILKIGNYTVFTLPK